jgi:hypothetical protein
MLSLMFQHVPLDDCCMEGGAMMLDTHVLLYGILWYWTA